MKFSLLLMPLFILAMILKNPGPVTVFRKAGAVSPGTARRPSSFKDMNMDLVKDAAKRGLLIPMGDGRYHVNLPRLQRRRRWILSIICIISAAIAIEGAILLWPMMT